MTDSNVHHGWLNFLDDASNCRGIGVEQCSVRDRGRGRSFILGGVKAIVECPDDFSLLPALK
jgi:hypothetical protein